MSQSSLPPVPFHMVNAFAATPYAGNQASVVLLTKDDPRSTDEKYMQTVARDFNLSETAYLYPLDDAEVPVYSLRWFTPAAVSALLLPLTASVLTSKEVPLCGHATLAAATALFNYVHPQATELHFQTRWRGELIAYRESDAGQGVRVGLSLPIPEIKDERSPEVLQAVLAASGLSKSDIIQIASVDFGGLSPIVQLREGVDLASVKFDPSKLVSDPGLPGVNQLGANHGLVRIHSGFV